MTLKTDSKTIVIFGGTSDIAGECLIHWLKCSQLTVVLVGRSKARLDVTAADLITRYPASKFYTVVLDFNNTVAIDLATKEIFTLIQFLLHMAVYPTNSVAVSIYNTVITSLYLMAYLPVLLQRQLLLNFRLETKVFWL